MVLVGRSAALAHGIDVVDVDSKRSTVDGIAPWPMPLDDDVIELAHPTRRKYQQRGIVHESKLGWSSDHVTTVDGRAVTSPGATVADITRRHGFDHGLVAGDSALRMGHSAVDLMRAADEAPNPAVALRTVACADRFSGGAAESLMRAQIIDAGLPAPEVQLRVFTGDKIHIGDVDMGYRGFLFMIEVHGKGKFSGRYGDGEARSMHEWQRESEMIAEGLTVLRVTYPQIVSGEALQRVIAGLDKQRVAVAAGATTTAHFLPMGQRWPEGFRTRRQAQNGWR